jgi:O-antigen/teichoic acid export membrane protein
LPATKHPECSATEEANTEAESPLRTRVSLQGLVNQVAGYGIGAVINRILGIAVACIYPMLLSKDEYGRLDVILSANNLLVVIFYLGLDTILQRFYYECAEEGQRKRLVSAVFCSVIGFTLFGVGILLLLSKPLALWLYGEPRYILYFRLMLCGMPFALVHSISLVVLRLQKRVQSFNILMAANLVMAAVVGISSILKFKIGAAGVLVGFIAGYIATGMAAIWMIRGEVVSSPFGGQLKKLLNLGLPLVISGTAMWLIGYVNRPILVHRVSADDLGLYAIASGAVGMISMLIAAFRNAWQPFAFSIMGREGYQTVYGHALTLFTAVGATIAACAGLFAPHLLLIINLYTHKNWSGAAPAVGPLAMGTVFSAMYFVVQTGAYIVRRTSVIAITMGIAALVNLLFNFLLIPYLGIMGAAFATALGHLTALISAYIVAQRLAPVPYHLGKLTTTILAASIVIAVAPIVRGNTVIGDLLMKLLILAIYGGILFAGRTVTREDLLLFRNISWFGQRANAQAPSGGAGNLQ